MSFEERSSFNSMVDREREALASELAIMKKRAQLVGDKFGQYLLAIAYLHFAHRAPISEDVLRPDPNSQADSKQGAKKIRD